jgi:NNP family nitrate/nitrite transporter-like MFS transporter
MDEMIQTFGISITEASMFMSLINLSTLSFNFVGGILLGKTGARKIMGTGLAVIAVSQIISGLTGSYIVEVSARLVLGMGIGVTMICMMQSVSEWFSLRELSTAFSIQVTGWVTGNVVGLAAPIPLSKALGTDWRGTFLAFGAFALVVNLIFWIFFREPKATQEYTSRQGEGIKLGEILRLKDFWILSLGFMGQILGMSIAMTWLPKSLAEAGWTASSAALLTTIFPLMGLPGNLAGGLIANKLGRKKPLFLISGVFLMISYVILALAAQSILVWVAMILGGWFNFFFVGPLLAMPSELPEIGPRKSGIFLGLSNLITGSGGFFAPLLAGIMRESTGSFVSSFLFAGLLSALLLIPGFVAREQRR